MTKQYEEVSLKIGDYPVGKGKPTVPLEVDYEEIIENDVNQDVYDREENYQEDSLYEDDGYIAESDDYLEEDIGYIGDDYTYEGDDEYVGEDSLEIGNYDIDDSHSIEEPYGANDYSLEQEDIEPQELEREVEEDSDVYKNLGKYEIISAQNGRVYDIRKPLFKRLSTYLVLLLLLLSTGLGFLYLTKDKGATQTKEPVITDKIRGLLGKKSEEVDALNTEPLVLTEEQLSNQMDATKGLSDYVKDKYKSVDNVTVDSEGLATITFKPVDYPISEDTTFNLIVNDILNIMWDIYPSGIKGVTFNTTANFEDDKGTVKEEQLIDIRYDKEAFNNIKNIDEFIAVAKVDSSDLFNTSTNYKINQGIFENLSNRAKGTLTTNEK